MGRSSGVGALIAVLALIFLSSDRKLTSTSFTDPSRAGFSYSSYQTWALASAEDVEADNTSELTEIPGRNGVIRTIAGRIPIPGGGTMPMPTPHVGRIDVGSRLRRVTPTTRFKYMEYEEEKETDQFEDVGGRKSVNLRLKPI